MINRTVLVGRLTADPDLRYTNNGIAVANLRVAVNRPFTNQQGEREADFINCTVWRKQAENVASYLSKGDMAGLDGRLQSRSYENQEGRRVTVVELQAESVQFLNTKNESQGSNQQSHSGQTGGNQYQNTQSSQTSYSGQQTNDSRAADISIEDDDLPF